MRVKVIYGQRENLEKMISEFLNSDEYTNSSKRIMQTAQTESPSGVITLTILYL